MNNSQEKILVVDDNATILTIINGVLNSLYKVYPVDSCSSALKFLEKQLPDLIILDIEMPEMSGDSFFHIMKSDPRTSNIPIIFLTAHNNIEVEAAAFKAGASDFMRKPINDTILLARVKTQLKLKAYLDSERTL